MLTRDRKTDETCTERQPARLERDRQTDNQTIYTGRQAGREANRQTDKLADRQAPLQMVIYSFSHSLFIKLLSLRVATISILIILLLLCATCVFPFPCHRPLDHLLSKGDL